MTFVGFVRGFRGTLLDGIGNVVGGVPRRKEGGVNGSELGVDRKTKGERLT